MSNAEEALEAPSSNGHIESEIVYPERYGIAKASTTQKLTPLDMNMPRIYGTRWILCFQLPPGTDKMKIFEDLKVGLAYTISEMPWLGGNVEPEEGTNALNNRIQVGGGAGGVRFRFNDLMEASNSFPSYAQLKQANFPLSELSTAQLSPLGVIPDAGQSVIAAQANFINGGLLLTVGAHHSVCDGIGFHNILDVWAQNTASASASNSFIRVDPLSKDRSCLMLGTPGAELRDFPEYVLAPTPKAAATDINTHQMAATPNKMPQMSARIFYFSQSALFSLKNAAGAHSTNDALNAFVWRQITLARFPQDESDAETSHETTTALLYAANIRSRISPPLPSNYLGNASMAGITKRMPVSKMKAADGLVMAAAAIRVSLSVFNTPDRVAQTIGLIASRPDPTDYKFAYHGFLGPDLSTTSWADFGIYDMDWGFIGKPEGFRIPGEGYDGSIIIFPRFKENGLEVVIGLEDGAMARLMEDAEFERYAKVWA